MSLLSLYSVDPQQPQQQQPQHRVDEHHHPQAAAIPVAGRISSSMITRKRTNSNIVPTNRPASGRHNSNSNNNNNNNISSPGLSWMYRPVSIPSPIIPLSTDGGQLQRSAVSYFSTTTTTTTTIPGNHHPDAGRQPPSSLSLSSNKPPFALTVVVDDDEPFPSTTKSIAEMTNEELMDTSTIPGFALIHSPPRKFPRGALVGTVVSDKMNKTINVAVVRYRPHPKYKKRYKYTRKFMAHDEHQVARQGDVVMITPCHKITKNKHFMVREIIRPKGTVY